AEGNPPPKTLWLKDSKEFNSFKKLTRRDGGVYQLKAMNKFGSATATVTVTVRYEPSVINPAEESVSVLKGDSVVFNCTADGIPAPTYRWKHPEADNVKITTKDSVSTVTITGASSSNHGVYECQAWNIHGNSTRKVTVEVTGNYTLLLTLVAVAAVAVVLLVYFVYKKKRTSGSYTFLPTNPSSANGSVAENGQTAEDIPLTTGRQRQSNTRSYTCCIVKHSPNSYTHSYIHTVCIYVDCIAISKLKMEFGSLIVLGVLVLFPEGAASPACEVNMDPSRVVVRFGDPVTVNCSTTREGVLGAGWESSVNPVNEPDSKIAVWNVSSLTVWDAEPKCFINYMNEPRQCVEKLDLVIYKLPESISLIAPEFMKIGEESTITCQVLDVAPVRYLSVKLYKRDEQLGSRSFTHDSAVFPVNESVPFPVTPTRADNGAEYTCVAELQLGPGGPKPNPAKLSPPLKIPVVYKPSLLSAAEENVEVREGGSIVLKCSADGSPAPTYEWKYPKADNVQEITKDGVSTVNITRASSSNNRVYECHAKNMYGVARKNITLTVKGRDAFVCFVVVVVVTGVGVLVFAGLVVGFICYRKRVTSFTVWFWLVSANSQWKSTYTMMARGPPGSDEPVETRQRKSNTHSYTCCIVKHSPNSYTHSYIHTVCIYVYCIAISKHKMEFGSLIVLGVLVLCAEGAASAVCDVNINPSRVVVRFGDPVTVNCSTTREDVLGAGWESSVNPVNEPDSKIAVWKVSSLTAWDAEPKCFINCMNEPRQCAEKLDLVIYKLPESISLIAPDFMKIGEESNITCQVLDVAPARYLSVKLYKRDEQLVNRSFTHNSTQFPVNERVPFPVTPTRADNGAEYTCVAELQLGPGGPKPNPEKRSPPLKIPVFYKPSLLSAAEENVEVREGGSIVLKCSADGSPAPTYEWKYPKADNVQEITKDGVSTVNITRASSSNSGFYTCHAKNRYGDKMMNITVAVKDQVIITEGRGRFVFWVVVGVGVLVFVGLVVGFICYRKRVT
ncbi:titin-like, partial [Huso huso]